MRRLRERPIQIKVAPSFYNIIDRERKVAKENGLPLSFPEVTRLLAMQNIRLPSLGVYKNETNKKKR